MDLDAVLGGTYEEVSSDADNEDEDKPVKVALKERVGRALVYGQRLDAMPSSCPTGHGFVNGKHFDLDEVSTFRLTL